MVQSSKQRENTALLTAAMVALAALLCWRFAGQATILCAALRWTALAALLVYGCLRLTLTAWIFIAMLLGAAVGYDFPNAATNLRVLALIFLRLIKTIIAHRCKCRYTGQFPGCSAHAWLRKSLKCFS